MSTSKAHLTGSLQPYQCYIGGRWVGAGSGRTFDDVEPYGGRLFARVAAGGRPEARAAIDAAAGAFPAWAATTPEVVLRARVEAADAALRRMTRHVHAYAEAIAEVDSRTAIEVPEE